MEEQGLANYLGNIDLDRRQVYRHPDGYVQTEHSFSFSPDGNTEILLPSIINGKPVAQEDAIRHFFNTGEHLGVFDKSSTMKSNNMNEQGFYKYVDDYADQIHKRQEKVYK